MTKFEKEVTVRPEHLDDLQHVNNVVYLQWVQEVAGAHWFAAAGRDTGIIWVVRKHEIEYFKPAFAEEKIHLVTWVEQMEGFRSVRRVDILRDNELLCSCLSHWIALDPKQNRPMRIPAQISNLF